MRHLVIALAMTLVSCTAQVAIGGGGVVPDSQPGIETVAPSTATPAATTSTTTAPRPLGLLTTTGVPVAVSATNGSWHWVVTPCGFTAVLQEGTPLYQTDVVLDPGHGGPFYTGAVAGNGLVEKHLNLELAQAVERLLVERGIGVVLTRTADYQSSLSVRSGLADALEAKALVSIHHNGPNQSASPVPGTEVFIQSGSDESRRLGGLLWQHVTTDLSAFPVDWVAAPDSAVMSVLTPEGRDGYGMVRYPETTAVLLEVGYMANPAEADFYSTTIYIRASSKAIANAIEEFLTTDAPGSGFGPPRIHRPNRGHAEDRCVDPPLE